MDNKLLLIEKYSKEWNSSNFEPSSSRSMYKNSELRRIAYLGGLVGLLGEKNIGVEILKRVPIIYDAQIKSDMEYLEHSGNNKSDYVEYFADLERISIESEFLINYIQEKESLANLSLEGVISLDRKLKDFPLRQMSEDLINPLMRIKELEKNGTTAMFHPNYIQDIGANNWPAGEQNEKYILPEEITEDAKRLFSQYFSEECKISSSSFSVEKRIIFEKKLSDLTFGAYSHFINDFVLNNNIK